MVSRPIPLSCSLKLTSLSTAPRLAVHEVVKCDYFHAGCGIECFCVKGTLVVKFLCVCSVDWSDCGAERTAPTLPTLSINWYRRYSRWLFDGFFHYSAREPALSAGAGRFIEEIRWFHSSIWECAAVWDVTRKHSLEIKALLKPVFVYYLETLIQVARIVAQDLFSWDFLI